MDIKRLMKSMEKHQTMIVELVVMSFISGWFVTNIIYRTYMPVEDISYIAQINRGGMLLIIILVALVWGVLYFMDSGLAKIVMFLSVYAYSILAINENQQNIYYSFVMAIISILALIYIKKDVIKIFDKIKINDRAGIVIVVIIGVMLTAFIGIITVYRYRTYSNSTFDFGIFAQMFENMKNTWHPTTSVERPEIGQFSHFGVHFSPIFYVLLPIYFIFPSAETVQLMQALVLGLAVIPLYFLCRHYKLSVKFSLAVCVLYCIFPATASGTFYDFHENACIPLFLFALILAVEKKKNIAIGISALLLVMVKEDAAFYLLVLGIYFLLSKRDKKRGAIMAVAAFIYFAIAMHVVHSYGLNDLASARFGNVMYDKDAGLGQIVITLLANPAYVLLQMLNEEKLQYFGLMVFPMGMALLQKKKYSRYILLGTFIVFNLIPSYQYMHDIGFQYNFGVVALMIYISIMTVSEWKIDRRNIWVLSSIVMTSILFISFTLPKWKTYTERYEKNKATIEAMDSALKLVPREGASVLVSGFIMPHLYDVEELTVIKDNVQVVQDYVVVDMRGGYSSDIDKVGTVLQQKYTLLQEVEDSIRVYVKNN